MDALFWIAIVFIFIVGIAALVYLIKSLIDMWREYATTKNETVLLLFILNIVGVFLSGSLLSMIVAIIFYWNRSKTMRNLGIFLLIAGPILVILLVIGSFTLYDAPMMEWEQFENEMNL
ncbi:hypothetical protein EVJ32_00230 [Exiguobacterium sp. SH5S4]|uniref:hypothetical protein n=1 Tax=Exiguobacterium sp. SH5S4 TaxID=2510961 RepID=UPI00103F0AE0|nr:hypothetical protein [Exiguobacterium sp. SH5S4]TCI27668.1 hypothetical protein EVJ32_00230 [Exiguobacterium sp. SH5S4]